MTLRNLPKKRRTNLAALVAMVIVLVLVSAPAVVTALEGGTAPAYATFVSHAD
jgi:hypothetical protein